MYKSSWRYYFVFVNGCLYFIISYLFNRSGLGVTCNVEEEGLDSIEILFIVLQGPCWMSRFTSDDTKSPHLEYYQVGYTIISPEGTSVV